MPNTYIFRDLIHISDLAWRLTLVSLITNSLRHEDHQTDHLPSASALDVAEN